MRAIIAALAALGGGVILAAIVVSLATGDGPEVYWLLLGPTPFLAIGLIGFLRQPGNRVTWWLVGVGVAFGSDVPWRRWAGPPRRCTARRSAPSGTRGRSLGARRAAGGLRQPEPLR